MFASLALATCLGFLSSSPRHSAPTPSQLREHVSSIDLAPGVKISPMGIGCWAWGDSSFWRYNSSQDSQLLDTFKACTERGINFFDTAEIYGFGKSELLIGRFERMTGTSSQIATKFAPLPIPGRLSADSVVGACIDSLDRLGTSKIALYQLHWPALPFNDRLLDGLAKCYERGLCAGVGVSNYGVNQLKYAHKRLAAKGIPLVSNQIQYSLLARSPESSGLLRTAQDLNVKVLAYSPLAQGVLCGKFSADKLPPGPRRLQVKSVLPRAQPLLDAMREISARENRTLSQIALNWCLQQGVVPIPGARSVSQALDNCGAMGWDLSSSNMAKLNRLSRESGVDMTSPLQGR